jgi:glycosyltransferase involved in cell wall biosynthesis
MNAAIIIPAYNEEKNIISILSVLKQFQGVYEVLVVNDGSSDKTSDIAVLHGFRVLELKQNMGKSYAMWMGLKNTNAPVVLFLDADLIGIKPEYIKNLIDPVCDDRADMTLGIFTSGRGITDLAQKLAPFLTGQRASKRWILESLPQEYWTTGFGIEIALTRYAKDNNLRMLDVYLHKATHAMKEEKLGFSRGVFARLRMYRDILKQLYRK